LENFLGGRKGCVAAWFGRRWTPDLPSPLRPAVQNYLLGSIHDGARLLGGGVTVASPKEGVEEALVYYVVDLGHRLAVVYPQLLGRLRTYALFRERSSSLLGALRTRAQTWAREVGLPSHIMDLAVAGSVAITMTPSVQETHASSLVQEAMCTATSLARPFLST
jgi:hypothetical protein